MLHPDTKNRTRRNSLVEMSQGLFLNVKGLFEQVHSWFTDAETEGIGGIELGVSPILGLSCAGKGLSNAL